MRKLLGTLFIMALFFAIVYADSQTKSPTTCVNNDGCAGECVGDTAWSNPSNALTSNNVYANSTNIQEDGLGTNWLHCYGYDFTIPSGVTVNSIILDIEHKRLPASFPKGTRIATPERERFIEDLKANDTIYAFNETTGQIIKAKVLRNPKHNATDNRRIITLNGWVETTDFHPFWTGSEWKNAADLKQGDTMLLITGEKDIVVSNDRLNAKTEVWTLATDVPNTYFANRYAVHNKITNPGIYDQYLYVSRATPAGPYQSGDESPNEWTTSEQFFTYSMPTTTPANINNSNFGPWLSVRGAPDISYGLVDYMNLTVIYSTGPTATFVSPTTNTGNTTNTWIAANLTTTNAANNTIYLYFANGTLRNSTFSTTTPSYVNYTGLPLGVYYLNATAVNNSTSLASTETRTINVTTSIIFVSPTTNTSNTTNNWIAANVTTVNANSTIYLYNSNGTLVNSTSVSGNSNYVNYTNIVSGTYYLNATAFNGSIIKNTETRTIGIIGWCYQETANVATSCGGSAGGYYADTSTYIDTTSSEARLFVNYSKPANALNTSLWQVKHGDNTVSGALYNTSIPSDCWTQTPLQFKFVSNESSNVFTSYGQCFNGTSWKTITSSITSCAGPSTSGALPVSTLYDGDWSTRAATDVFGGATYWMSITANCFSGAIYEEAMYWNMIYSTPPLPTISFVSPTTNSSNSATNNWIAVNVTFTNATNATVTLYKQGTLINTTTSTSSPIYINYTGLDTVSYQINASATNGINTTSTETRNITISNFCYQESANVSSCGNLVAGSYSLSHNQNYIIMNYTKPGLATGIVWQIKNQNGIQNVTVSNSCWNYSGVWIAFRYNALQSGGYPNMIFNSTWDCYNGSWSSLLQYNYQDAGTCIYDGSTVGDYVYNAIDGNWDIGTRWTGFGNNEWVNDSFGGCDTQGIYEEAVWWSIPEARCSWSGVGDFDILSNLNCNITGNYSLPNNYVRVWGSSGRVNFTNVNITSKGVDFYSPYANGASIEIHPPYNIKTTP